MPRRRRALAALLFAAFVLLGMRHGATPSTPAGAAPAPAAAPAGDGGGVSPTVTRFVQSHCVRCHGPQKQKGSVRLDTLPAAIADPTTALRYQDVLDALNLSEMPPEDEPQPSKQELADVLEALTGNLTDARKRLTDTGGQVVLRRLNKREYSRTIEALFGVPVDTSLLPDDGTVDGFDTLGQAHGFSSLHLERYLALGRQVLDHVIVTGERRRKTQLVKQHTEIETQVARRFGDETPRIDKRLSQAKGKLASGGGNRAERELQLAIAEAERGLVDAYEARAETATGALVPFRGLNFSAWTTIGHKPAPGRYRVRVRCGAAADAPADGLFLKVIRGEFRAQVADDVTCYQVTGPVAAPQVIEFDVDIDHVLSNRLTFERRDDRMPVLPQFAKARDYYYNNPAVGRFLDDKRPDLWIDWVEVEGPLARPAAPLSAAALFGGREPKALKDDEARSVVERFAFEAFRRQRPDPQYVNRLMGIYQSARAHGATPDVAIKDTLVAVLASPRFLYLYEPQPEGQPPRPLDDRELAVRLAYFLWSAPPDDEIYRLAAEGKLRDPAALAQQVDRMIRDERAAHFVETFTTQWLELERLARVKPDATPTERYDDAVQRESRREVYAFFQTLLRENLPISNLLGSDFAVVNALMARFYDLPGVEGDAFRKVPLPKDSVRGGLLGQSAILTLTGTGERTSPVERGVYVLRKLLHRPPPPAPANVPMLDEKGVGARSIRDTLAAHMNSAQCNSCHRRIDPLGFAMENFDPVGRWRTEVVSTDGTAKFPIDPAGVMPDGERQFASFAEMRRHLASDRDALLGGLTEALMTYAVGRTVGFTDEELVHQIVNDTARDGYGLRTLIQNVVRSKAFLTK